MIHILSIGFVYRVVLTKVAYLFNFFFLFFITLSKALVKFLAKYGFIYLFNLTTVDSRKLEPSLTRTSR